MRFFGTVLAMATVVFTIWLCAGASVNIAFTFIDPATFVILFGICVGVLLSVNGYKPFISGVNAVISRRYTLTNDQREKSVAIFQLLIKTVWCAGFIELIIPVCTILLMEYDPSTIRPSISVMLLSLLLALFINMVFLYPALYTLRNRLSNESAHSARLKEKETIEKLLQLCYQKGLTYDDIMNADDINIGKRQ